MFISKSLTLDQSSISSYLKEAPFKTAENMNRINAMIRTIIDPNVSRQISHFSSRFCNKNFIIACNKRQGVKKLDPKYDVSNLIPLM